MSQHGASALSRNKGELTANWGGVRKPLEGSTGESAVHLDLSFMPLTFIALQDAFVAHLSSLKTMKPNWHPILIDKKEKDGTKVQTCGLSKFLDYDDSMTLAFLRFIGLIMYVPQIRCRVKQ